MTEAKIQFKIGQIEFSGEGDTTWLEKQVDKIIEKSPALLKLSPLPEDESSSGRESELHIAQQLSRVSSETPHLESTPKLENVFAIEKDKIKILKDIPGTNKAKKTVNAALLCAYGKKKMKNEESVTFNEIQQVCRKHACLDMPNFAPALKRKRKKGTDLFIVEGSGKSQTIKLTAPGEKAASDLVTQLSTQ